MADSREEVDAAAASTGLIWLDVRTEGEASAGQLPCPDAPSEWGPQRNVVNWPLAQVLRGSEDEAAEKAGSHKGATILVFCMDGGGAAQAKAELEKWGYTNVVNGGGFNDVSDLATAGKDLECSTWLYPRMATEYTYQMLAGSWGALFLIVVIVIALGHGELTEVRD